MNEIRDLLIGIDFGKKYSQICYYDRKAKEARSISMKVGASQYEAPTCICRRMEQKDYCIGLEAKYFAKEKNGILLENLYELSLSEERAQVGEEKKEPWELLAVFISGLLQFLGNAEPEKNIKCLAITVEELTKSRVKNFQKAVKSLGIPEDKLMLLDYAESFYYYAMCQKETWNRYVGWYAFTPQGVDFRRLSMNVAAKPVTVTLEPAVHRELSREDVPRDVEFYQFLQRTAGDDLYSCILITGEGFDQKWAVRSVPELCKKKRRVLSGNNLFASGAVLAGKEKLEDKRLRNYLYLSDALVKTEIGMEMQIMGSPAYYTLLEAGKNWYECSARCELILDEAKELIFIVSAIGESEKKKVSMKLSDLPKRPNKTTRLQLEMAYTSVKECQITVRDMGFGEMYPSTGKVWTETVQW